VFIEKIGKYSPSSLGSLDSQKNRGKSHDNSSIDFKSNNIFKPALKNNGVALLTIDDHCCRILFKLNGNRVHTVSTDDIRDILDVLDTSEILP